MINAYVMLQNLKMTFLKKYDEFCQKKLLKMETIACPNRIYIV